MGCICIQSTVGPLAPVGIHRRLQPSTRIWQNCTCIANHLRLRVRFPQHLGDASSMGILRGAAQGISHNEPPLIDTRQHSYDLHTLVIRVARRGPDTSIANFGPPHDTPLAHTVPRGLLPANQTPGQQLASAPIRAGSFGHRNSLFARQVSSITQPRPKRFHPFHQKPVCKPWRHAVLMAPDTIMEGRET
jgi:hypothetical protein